MLRKRTLLTMNQRIPLMTTLQLVSFSLSGVYRLQHRLQFLRLLFLPLKVSFNVSFGHISPNKFSFSQAHSNLSAADADGDDHSASSDSQSSSPPEPTAPNPPPQPSARQASARPASAPTNTKVASDDDSDDWLGKEFGAPRPTKKTKGRGKAGGGKFTGPRLLDTHKRRR